MVLPKSQLSPRPKPTLHNHPEEKGEGEGQGEAAGVGGALLPQTKPIFTPQRGGQGYRGMGRGGRSLFKRN
jgi:hypothetical protein